MATRTCDAQAHEPLPKGSFRRWMREQERQDDAVRAIQTAVRSKLLPTAVVNGKAAAAVVVGGLSSCKALPTLATSVASTYSSTGESSSTSSDEADEEHEQLEVFLWHGAVLGAELDECPVTGYPRVVDDANCNDSLPGMWNVRNGDFLVSVNDASTHRAHMSMRQVERILRDGVRPAVLRFRRPGTNEMEKRVMTRARRLTAPARQEQLRRRERLEQSLSYIVWREEDASLGIGLKPDKSRPYPVVSEVGGCGAVARQAERSPVKLGDLLLSINHLDVSQIGVKRAVDMLQFAPRPLVLTFRRSVQPAREARCLDL
ncbi:hypothetical protein PybrP1_011960 [[Pythium] brassicae (nom. inval.)]|nr:hypothetical protein PybrP1_011960 [[Pythium] brassicae (nom. inval.)]